MIRPFRPGPLLLAAGLVVALLYVSQRWGAAAEHEGDPYAASGTPPPHARPLPGVLRVSDVLGDDEGWVMLDGPAGHVLTVGPGGQPGTLIGRRGEGPGELRRPAHVARLDGAVAVLEMTGLRLDVFPTSVDRPPARLTLPALGCAATVASDLQTWSGRWLVLRRCLSTSPPEARLLSVMPSGETVVAAALPLGAPRDVDPLLHPLLLVYGGGVFLGTTRARCLTRVLGAGPGRVCAPPAAEGELSDSVLETWRDRFGAGLRATGLRLSRLRALPPLADVRPLGHDLAFLRPTAEGRSVWTRAAGSEERPLDLAAGTRAWPGPRGTLVIRHTAEHVLAWVVEPSR